MPSSDYEKFECGLQELSVQLDWTRDELFDLAQDYGMQAFHHYCPEKKGSETEGESDAPLGDDAPAQPPDQPDPPSVADTYAQDVMGQYVRVEGPSTSRTMNLDKVLNWVISGTPQLGEIKQDIASAMNGEGLTAVKDWVAALGSLWYGGNAWGQVQTGRLLKLEDAITDAVTTHPLVADQNAEDVEDFKTALKNVEQEMETRGATNAAEAERAGDWLSSAITIQPWQIADPLGYASWIEVQGY